MEGPMVRFGLSLLTSPRHPNRSDFGVFFAKTMGIGTVESTVLGSTKSLAAKIERRSGDAGTGLGGEDVVSSLNFHLALRREPSPCVPEVDGAPSGILSASVLAVGGWRTERAEVAGVAGLRRVLTVADSNS